MCAASGCSDISEKNLRMRVLNEWDIKRDCPKTDNFHTEIADENFLFLSKA